MTRRSKVVLALVTSALVVVIGLVAGFHAAIRGFAPNVAEESAAPLERVIREAGGIEVCANGYNGRAPWNNLPWYQVFYEIEDSPDLGDGVLTVSHGVGHDLSELPPQDRAFAPPSQEFRSSAAEPALELIIMRGDQASSGCDAGTRQRMAASGNAVIVLNVRYTRPPE